MANARLYDAADVLYARMAPVRAVQGGEVNQFRRVLDLLAEVSDEIDSPLAIVGGLAAVHHGVPVTTADVDVAVVGDRADDLLNACESHGFVIVRRSPEAWHLLRLPDAAGDVGVELIPSGRKSPRDPAYAPPNPTPQALGVEHGLGYARFDAWVVMKLVANREKDRYHLVEALKLADHAQVADVVVRLRSLDPSYLEEFNRLVRAAEDENQQSW
jgi:hypothetical protein